MGFWLSFQIDHLHIIKSSKQKWDANAICWVKSIELLKFMEAKIRFLLMYKCNIFLIKFFLILEHISWHLTVYFLASSVPLLFSKNKCISTIAWDIFIKNFIFTYTLRDVYMYVHIYIYTHTSRQAQCFVKWIILPSLHVFLLFHCHHHHHLIQCMLNHVHIGLKDMYIPLTKFSYSSFMKTIWYS